ncbi:type VI secretion system tube protein Hcp [Solirubrobacter ginsenosidimutans]|uniref:Type VI secretion system tube protein Hcp n=1 Tax=Solirubrobacter ginsenosidimutans TaxID=490573 RepID=A0A9X3S399_9ACTN|nr:type VI secretion system tube protein Hcp [Solirubrobacter ginsenosidimutans]MDA0159253.1 type VI secretion system tube protein Hcp [Solirubrobacter ginsenosidimutans]
MRKSRLITFAATAASIAATLVVAPMASAADDYFLKIDGITGEATTGATQGVIKVNAFEWGAENKVTIGSTSGGAGVGKASLNELTIEKPVDSTSPVLFQKLGQGASLGGMELVARKAGPTGSQIYMRYSFQPVFVTSQTQTGAGDDGLTEKLVFTYGAVKQTFVKQTTTGAPGATVFGAWNQVTNSASMLIPGMTDTSGAPRIN